MLIDRRKPWQKAANIKWSRCGHMLQETATAMAKTRRARPFCGFSPREFDRNYAKAWAKAWGKDPSEFRSVVIHGAGIADDATREKNRREGRKILARTRAQIDRRMIGGPGPNASRNPGDAIKAYAAALGITISEAHTRVAAQREILSDCHPVVAYRLAA